MKLNIIMLVIMIVITIIYLVFSICNTFITKKQVVLSLIDGFYMNFLGIFIGAVISETKCWIVAIIVIFVFTIWMIIASKQWEKNYNKKYKTK